MNPLDFPVNNPLFRRKKIAAVLTNQYTPAANALYKNTVAPLLTSADIPLRRPPLYAATFLPTLAAHAQAERAASMR